MLWLILLILFLYLIFGGGQIYLNKWRGFSADKKNLYLKTEPQKNGLLIAPSFPEPRYCSILEGADVSPNCEIWYYPKINTVFKFYGESSYFTIFAKADNIVRITSPIVYLFKCVPQNKTEFKKYSTVVKKRVFTILDKNYISDDCEKSLSMALSVEYKEFKKNPTMNLELLDKLYRLYRNYKTPIYPFSHPFIFGGVAPAGINLYYRYDGRILKTLNYIFSKKNRHLFNISDSNSQIHIDWRNLNLIEKGSIMSFGLNHLTDDFPFNLPISQIADEFGFKNWNAQISKVNLKNGFKNHFDRVNRTRKLLVYNIGADIYYDMIPVFSPAENPIRLHIPSSTIIEITSDARYHWTHGIPSMNITRYAIIIRE